MEKNKQEWIKMKFWTVSAVLGMCLTCFTVLYFFYFSKKMETNIDCNHWWTCSMGNHNRACRSFMVLLKDLV